VGLLEPHGRYGGCCGEADLILAKLSFYERVIVVKCDDDPNYIGMSGHVLGMGDDPGELASYGVLLETTDSVVCFSEDELQSTGEIADRSKFYDDTKAPIRVRVVDGKGYIAD